MTPRAYSQDRRAETTAATRRRIIDAAMSIYGEQGIARTTLQVVANRADVARGTVANHFGTPDGLLEAVLDDMATTLELPDERVQDGAASEPDRIRRYVDAMFRFYVRSEAIWPAVRGDLDHPLLQAREADYYRIVGRLYSATFGDLAGDRILGAAVRAYVNYAPLHDLRAASLTLDEAIELVAESLIDLVDRRRKAISGSSSGGR